jgi:hypothetical protein
VSVPPIISDPGNMPKCTFFRKLRYIYRKLLKRKKKIEMHFVVAEYKGWEGHQKPSFGK